jgi:hypothetical protein
LQSRLLGSEEVATMGAMEGRVYQHPMSYLLGLEGVALLRAFAGEFDE